MRRNLMIGAAVLAAFFAFDTRSADAGGPRRGGISIGWGSGGIRIGGGGYYRGGFGHRGGYGHRGYGYGQRVWHDTSHWDYTPGYHWRHGNHYHYEPGRYHFHRDGHWDHIRHGRGHWGH